MKNWWKWLASLVVMAGLAGCGRGNNSVRLKDIDARIDSDPASAVAPARQYVAEHPESAVGWRTLGWALLKSETDQDGARDAFKRALELDPEDDNSYVGLGGYYRRTNDLATANEMYARAIELEPDQPEAYSSMSAVDILRGDYANAVAHGEKAWALDSSNAAVAANLAVAYHYNGEFGKRDVFIKSAEDLGYARMDRLREMVEP
jgi:Flp pilus assembly protein TadD